MFDFYFCNYTQNIPQMREDLLDYVAMLISVQKPELAEAWKHHLLMMDRFRQGWRSTFQIREHTSPKGANVQGLLIVGEAVIITVSQSFGIALGLKVMKQHIFMKPPERCSQGSLL